MKRVCMLTGASGTLGQAFCRLHCHEYDIVAVYHTRPVATPSSTFDPLNLELELPAAHILRLKADLTRESAIERVVARAIKCFGHVDLLVNAAAHSRWSPLLDTKDVSDAARCHFELNAVAPLRLALELVQKFWRGREQENRQRNRNIVNLSSTAGQLVYKDQGQALYGASKAALELLTRHMANEFAALGVRANAIAPNSFPSIVCTESVVNRIVGLDRSAATGTVITIDTGHGSPPTTRAPGKNIMIGAPKIRQ